jgi:hypothetical protein
MKNTEKTQIERAKQRSDIAKKALEEPKDNLFTWDAIIHMKYGKIVHIIQKDYIYFEPYDYPQPHIKSGRDIIINQLNDPRSIFITTNDPSDLYLKSNIESIKFKKFNDKELT